MLLSQAKAKSGRLKIALALIALALPATAGAQEAKPKPKRDDVYRAIAVYATAQSDSPLTNVLGALDEVIEVERDITLSDKDGKATAVVKEKAAAKPEQIRVLLAPAAGGKWVWEMFENSGKLFPVERLIPYAKDELPRRKQATVTSFNQLLEAMTKQAEAAARVLDTAKAVIKKDPEPLAALTAAATALAKARAASDIEAVKAANKEVSQAVEQMAALGDTYPDLKANDAYLRLSEELTMARKGLAKARENYLAAVAAYNDGLQRLPFSLVAFGLGFTKLEAQIEAEP